MIRRGSTANAIADLVPSDPELRVIDFGDLDHGGLVVTGASGSELAHIIWWNRDFGTIDYTQWTTGAPGIISVPLPGAPPGAIRGAGDTVYGWSGVYGWPDICPLYPSIGTCAVVRNNAASYQPWGGNIMFGAPGTLDESIGRTCPIGGGSYQRCFDVEQPVAFAASPTIAGRIYVAWHGMDPTTSNQATSIYFSRTTDSLANWTSPLRVHTRSDNTTFFVDASIVVDQSDFIAVTWSEIAQGATSPTATARLAYSLDGGASFTVATLPSAVQWNPVHLDYHCRRKKFFLGEYREGGYSGHALYNTLPRSSSMRVTQDGFWSSRASIF